MYLYLIGNNKDDKLYIGLTDNTTRRLKEHNSQRTSIIREEKIEPGIICLQSAFMIKI